MPSSSTIFTAAVAALAPAVAALTVPGGSNPTAGAINSPWGGSDVTAGTPFTISWVPDTAACGNSVDLVLLYGPSSAQMNAISYISQSVSNTGSYSWTPDASLKPSDGTYMYGIELICDSTQIYQYTSRFAIANPEYTTAAATTSTTSTSSAAPNTATNAESSTSGTQTTTATVTQTTTAVTQIVHSSSSASTFATVTFTNSTVLTTVTSCPPSSSSSVSVKASSSVAPAPMYTTKSSSMAVLPTGTTGVATSTGKTSASTTKPVVVSTGAASNVKLSIGGLVAAAAVAVVAL